MRLREIVTETKSAGIYNPRDLFTLPETVFNAREWFRRSALRDGLDAEAADEAASVALICWLERDYSGSGIARGDHPRALFATRKFLRRSGWRAPSDYRRAQANVFGSMTGSEAGRSPRPDAILAALEAAAAHGLTYVPAREKWARRGWRKVGRGPGARWEETGRKNHRQIQRSRMPARRLLAEADRVGGLAAVFTAGE